MILTPRKYTVTVVATAALASLCVVAFCFIVDPYKLYPAVPGLSPQTSINLLFVMRLHTPHAVENVRPSVLVTGNSRAATFPPELLGKPGDTSYNASLPGATLREIRRMIEHAHAINPLKLVFIGVDSEIMLRESIDKQALQGRNKKGEGDTGPVDQQAIADSQLQMFANIFADNMIPDEPHRYRRINPSLSDRWGYAYNRLEDFGRTLFSIDALEKSYQIVFGSGPDGDLYHDDGTWELQVEVGSPAILLYQRMVQQTYLRSVTEKSVPIVMDELTELLDFTAANQIQTVFLILPMQGLLLNTIELAGAWEQHLKWQRQLVKRVNAHGSDTKIYGMEDQARIVLEKVGTPNALFIDGIHLNRAAGTEVLACLMNPCELDIHPTLLDQDSIDSYLERTEILRKKYAQNDPGQLEKMRGALGLN